MKYIQHSSNGLLGHPLLSQIYNNSISLAIILFGDLTILQHGGGMTQQQPAKITNIASSSISRIERGLLVPAPHALTDIRNALETGADSILSACIAEDTPMRWAPLAEKLGGPDLEERHRIEAVLNCLMETI